MSEQYDKAVLEYDLIDAINNLGWTYDSVDEVIVDGKKRLQTTVWYNLEEE